MGINFGFDCKDRFYMTDSFNGKVRGTQVVPMIEASQLREPVITQPAQVFTAKEWLRMAREMLSELLPSGWSGTAEDARIALLHAGLQPPHHHNSWGGMFRGLVGTVLQGTGEYRHMKSPKSHRRRTPVYTKA